MKKSLSVLLSVLLLLGTIGFGLIAAAEETPTYNVGDHIQFGTYPQTRVDETEELAAAAAAATWKSYGYYSGNGTLDGLMQPGDWMQFADFYCGGEKYRAVTISQPRPYSTCGTPDPDCRQKENGYTSNHTYYFKYDTLTWRILDPNTGFVMCENVIDSQPFQNIVWHKPDGVGSDYYQGVYSTDYADQYPTSTIRNWLNHDFYETAFSAGQKASILSAEFNNDAEYGYQHWNGAPTTDKISLLSLADIMNAAYGFENDGSGDFSKDPQKMTRGTDYAKCQGLSVDTSRDGISGWWLRTAAGGSMYVCYVYTYNSAAYYNTVHYTSCGVRPVCYLSTLTDDSARACYLYSAGETAHNLTDVSATEATADEHGYTAGVYCPDCETWLSGHEVIHNHLGAQTIIKEPTENEEGIVDIVCTVCGEHGQYTAAKTEPKPDDNDVSDSGGFWQRITSFAKGIIDWFLRLFKWFGK